MTATYIRAHWAKKAPPINDKKPNVIHHPALSATFAPMRQINAKTKQTMAINHFVFVFMFMEWPLWAATDGKRRVVANGIAIL